MLSSQQDIVARASLQDALKSRRLTMGHLTPSISQKRQMPATPGSRKALRTSVSHARHELADQEGDAEESLRISSQVMASSRRTSSLLPPSAALHTSVESFNSGKIRATAKLHSDPRNIKSTDFQRTAIKNIVEYLLNVGYPQVSSTTLRALASKDFQNIFRFLHLRIDPGYVYGKKKFEEEAIDILKTLRYPLADTIGIKSLYSVAAPHSYPTFLALLLWMTETCQMLDSIDKEDSLEEENFELNSRVDPVQMDMLFCDYTLSTYRLFMDGIDDYTEVENELQNIFDTINDSNQKQIEISKKEEKQLLEEYQELKECISPLEGLRAKYKEMENDMAKYQDYCKNKERKITKYTELNEKIKVEVNKLERKLEEITQRCEHLTDLLQAKNISVEEIERLDNENLKLASEMESLRSRKTDIQKSTWTKQAELERLKKDTEMNTHAYRNLALNLNLLEAGGSHTKNDLSDLLTDTLSTNSKELSAVDLQDTLLPQAQALEQQYTPLVHEATQEATEVENKLNSLEIKVGELRKEEKQLSEAIAKWENDVKLTRESSMLEFQAHNRSMEELDRDRKELLRKSESQVVETRKRKEALRVKLAQARMDTKDRIDSTVQSVAILAEKLQTTSAYLNEQADEFKTWSFAQFDKLKDTYSAPSTPNHPRPHP